MYKCTVIYLDHKFYITTLIGPKQVLDHNFIWITTSFTSPLYLDHIKFSVITLLGSYPSFTSSLYLDQNKFYITMFVASVDADGDLVFYPFLHCKASDAHKLISNGRQYALIFTCYIILINPYIFEILSLPMGAGGLKWTRDWKELVPFTQLVKVRRGQLVLALPNIRFSWNFYQIISGTKYE